MRISNVCKTLALLAGLFAASAEAGKIAVLDMQELFSKSPQAIAAKKRLDNKFQPKKDSFEKKQLEFKQKGEKYTRDKDVLSAQEKKKQETQLQALRAELESTGQNLDAEYNESQSQEMEAFVATVKDVAAKIAKAEDLDIVIPAHFPLYTKEGVDITDKVIKELSKLGDKS
ncbi:MAG: OmpH family outer membrane protein [Gammaproteobacteria bacterium]